MGKDGIVGRMEWRHVYTRDEIWEDRRNLLEAEERGEQYLLTKINHNFLNSYLEKCAKGIITPIWPQDFRKANQYHHNNNTGNNANHNTGHKSSTTSSASTSPSMGGNTSFSGAQGHHNQFAGSRKSGWRERRVIVSDETTEKKSKFGVQAWEPQVLDLFTVRLRELRALFNKWTFLNHAQMNMEFQKWWKEANDFGYWKPLFVLYEWFHKLQNERVPQVQWYQCVFKTFESAPWPIQQKDRQVNPRVKNYLYDYVNSLPVCWQEGWGQFQRMRQHHSVISWKQWITVAVEIESRQWVEKVERDDGSDMVVPENVWCAFLATIWLNGSLPIRFLPWSMLTLPQSMSSEETAWKWRGQLWKAIEDIGKGGKVYVVSTAYLDSWRRWKNSFQEMALEVLEPDTETWSLRLRFMWSQLVSSWNIQITQQDITKHAVIPTHQNSAQEVIHQEEIVEVEGEENELEGDEYAEREGEGEGDGSILTEEDYSNVRCLVQEWKEMGYRGWMDGYFPEWYMEKGNYAWKQEWWDLFFYTTSQVLDLRSVWEDDSWKKFIAWILESGQDSSEWIGVMCEEMETDAPEWTIDCPYYHTVIQEMRNFCEKNTLS